MTTQKCVNLALNWAYYSRNDPLLIWGKNAWFSQKFSLKSDQLRSRPSASLSLLNSPTPRQLRTFFESTEKPVQFFAAENFATKKFCPRISSKTVARLRKKCNSQEKTKLQIIQAAGCCPFFAQKLRAQANKSDLRCELCVLFGCVHSI